MDIEISGGPRRHIFNDREDREPEYRIQNQNIEDTEPEYRGYGDWIVNTEMNEDSEDTYCMIGVE